MLESISNLAKDFLEAIKEKPVRLVSHFDTDGITSAAIIIRALRRLDKKFSVRIVKGLDEVVLKEELARSGKEVLLFTDLGSSSLDYFKDLKEKVFVLDHHEIDLEKVKGLNGNLKIVNPHLVDGEDLCGAALCYLFAKELSEKNKDLANLAIIGMIGDRHDNSDGKIYREISEECDELEIRKGLLIFSATRPLRRSLEYSTSCYIPGVTGSSAGVTALLRELGISGERTLSSLNEDEMSKLVTSVLIRRADGNQKDEIIGNIYMMKIFNRKEDVREISLSINSCSRLGYSDIALAFCLGHEKARQRAQEIYVKYKQELISGLKVAEKVKHEDKHFVLINAGEEIKDAIIGTVCSMLSSSAKYDEGMVLIGMAHNQDKIKVSARIVGRGRNLKEVLERTVCEIEADVGGHKNAAGCMIRKEDEQLFLEQLKKTLEVEVVKV